MNQKDGFSFVEVVYDDSNGVTNRPYTYKTRLDLRLGQKVFAPTYKSPTQRATVTAVNCPEPGFKCRDITEVVPEEVGTDA